MGEDDGYVGPNNLQGRRGDYIRIVLGCEGVGRSAGSGERMNLILVRGQSLTTAILVRPY